MSVYFDACLLVPLFVEEDASARANAYLDALDAPIHVSDLGIAEVGSAFSRRVRKGDDSEDIARATLAAFDEWTAEATTRLPVQPEDVIRAGMIVRRFELKLLTPDAIHLAICERKSLTLVTLDMRLGEAAAMLAMPHVVP